jgi:hypothetical protein
MTYTWPVLIALNRCDHIEEAVTHIKGLAEERPISWTTWTRTLDFFIDALDEQDVARFEMDLEAAQKQIAELQCPMSWGLVPPGDSAPQTREQLEQECSWMLRSLNGRHMLAFLANLEGIACSSTSFWAGDDEETFSFSLTLCRLLTTMCYTLSVLTSS